jgi:hypothetical protein
MGRKGATVVPELCDVIPQRVEDEPDGALPQLVRIPASAL